MTDEKPSEPPADAGLAVVSVAPRGRFTRFANWYRGSPPWRTASFSLSALSYLGGALMALLPPFLISAENPFALVIEQLQDQGLIDYLSNENLNIPWILSSVPVWLSLAPTPILLASILALLDAAIEYFGIQRRTREALARPLFGLLNCLLALASFMFSDVELARFLGPRRQAIIEILGDQPVSLNANACTLWQMARAETTHCDPRVNPAVIANQLIPALESRADAWHIATVGDQPVFSWANILLFMQIIPMMMFLIMSATNLGRAWGACSRFNFGEVEETPGKTKGPSKPQAAVEEIVDQTETSPLIPGQHASINSLPPAPSS